MKTKVLFLIDKEADKSFAFFPEMDYNVNLYGKEMKTCYAHLGQHSACLLSYAEECREAKYNEWYDLYKELRGQGYNSLDVVNSEELEYHRNPTEGEIRFGEGATHYRNFPIGKVINRKGELKEWLLSKDDGLRYYR